MLFASYFHVPARRTSHFRRLSTISLQPINPRRSIYVSESTDPFFNLVLEDWLFRNAPRESPLLLVYRNSPCVVIGRNQNPWKEVNLRAARTRGVPWLRRKSGGGTVYHDLGNTNFSVHMPRDKLDIKGIASRICGAVRSFEIDARVNERNDICVGPYKVSGSAYKIISGRSYHHGTMLISSELETLGDLLHSEKATMESKGVASVRQPVINLKVLNEQITHEAFTQAVIRQFETAFDHLVEPSYVEDSETVRNDPFFRNEMRALQGWQWKYGQTPEFNYTIEKAFPWGDIAAKIHSKKGLILTCDFDLKHVHRDRESLRFHIGRLSEALRSVEYGELSDDFSDLSGDARVKDVVQWLSICMSS